jgi:hypothetical protein
VTAIDEHVASIIDTIFTSLRAQGVTLLRSSHSPIMTGMEIAKCVEKIARDVVQSEQSDDFEACGRVQDVLEKYNVAHATRGQLIGDLVLAVKGELP